ncbi:phage tail tape measure protein [Shewanella sp. c952]|uniref:tape measure protein n=1 Tax=Shewanella sp. c952 TaxID=2815913 RepID=UPI001BC06617|nr:tape measure protein [Shewanella sp. c952]GIU15591.1 phage tail tape measure protein [Shewanella sp. c952]
MSFKDQVINLIIKGKDLFSSEAKKSEKALAGLAAQSETLNERLQDIKDLQGSINAIDDLTRSISKGESAYSDNSVALDKLVKEQKQAIAAVKQLDAAHKSASIQTDKTEQEYKQAKAQLAEYEQQLLSAKENVDKLSNEQKKSSQASKEQAAALSKASADLKQLELAQSHTEQSAKELSTALDKQRRELLEMGVASDDAARKKADYTLKVKNARSELNRLASTLGKSKTELEQQTSKLTRAGYSMNKLADASKELKQQQTAAETALSGVNKQLARHDKLLAESKKSAKDFSGSISGVTQSLLAMAGAYIGVDRLWESLKDILSAGDDAQSFSVQMTAVMGSIAAGEQATAWIKDFANNTGTKLESVQSAFSALKTFGIDPMNGSLQSMVDYNSRLGGSQEKLEGIILAVGQAWAKQKLQGEEILQLVERGVPVWDLLEKVTGKNVTQLQKLSASGELGRETIKALFDEMGKQANGQASKSLDRLSGQINLISNKFEEFKRIIADSGVYQVAVDFLKDLNATFDQLNQDGKIKAAAQDISNFFTTIVRDGGESLKTTLENITAFTSGLNVISGGIRLFWNGLSAGVSALAASVTLQLAKMMEGFTKLYEFVGADQLASSARDAAAALNAIGDAYVSQVEQDGKDVRAAWLQITGEVEQAATKAYSKISSEAKKSASKQVESSATVASAQDKQAASAKELQLAMTKAGIETIATLKQQEAAALKTFKQVEQGAKDGIASTYELNQAFLKYAEAAVEAAAASDTQVDASIRQQAAALGLTDDLAKVIEQYQRLKESQADFDSQTQQNLDQTQQGIQKSAGVAVEYGTTIENTVGLVKKSAQQAGYSLAGVAEFFTAYLKGVTDSVAKLSEGATVYFKNMLYHQNNLVDSSSELDKAIQQYGRLTNEVRDLENVLAKSIDFTGISTFAREAEIAGKKTEAAYHGQRIELLKLVEALEATGGANLDLVRKAERAAKSLELVNDQDMGRLTSAIDSAINKMDELRSSAQDTLSSLKDELDGLQGNDKAIEQREYQRQLLELQEQLKKAQQSGDDSVIADLLESEKILNRVHQLKMDEFKAQENANKSSEQKIAAEQNVQQPKRSQSDNKSSSNNSPTLAFDSSVQAASHSALLVLQVGSKKFDTQLKNHVLNELLAEIDRQDRLGA